MRRRLCGRQMIITTDVGQVSDVGPRGALPHSTVRAAAGPPRLGTIWGLARPRRLARHAGEPGNKVLRFSR